MIKIVAETTMVAIVGMTSSGTSAIGLAAMTTPTNTITTDSTWIPLGFFLGGIALTVTTVWKVATHKTKTDSKIANMQEKIKWLEKAINKDN